MKRIVFMGTPAFSVPILESLIASEMYDVVAVVTQPDRAVGRKRKLTPTPVKESAVAANIPVFQPKTISQDQEVFDLLANDVDLIVTAAFGQFLPERLLELPHYGAINVHASLLPKYRGGAPVHYALWNGDEQTGVTIMRMVKQMDAGDMIAQAELSIDNEDNVSTLFDKLSLLGRDLLMDTLPDFFAGVLEEVPQDERQVTYSPNITREQERIDWKQAAMEIQNQVRGMNAWPGAHTMMKEVRWKIWQAEPVENQTTEAKPGTIVQINKKPVQFWVACGEQTVLSLTEIQPAGKKKMPIASFINGGSGAVEKGDQFE